MSKLGLFGRLPLRTGGGRSEAQRVYESLRDGRGARYGRDDTTRPNRELRAYCRAIARGASLQRAGANQGVATLALHNAAEWLQVMGLEANAGEPWAVTADRLRAALSSQDEPTGENVERALGNLVSEGACAAGPAGAFTWMVSLGRLKAGVSDATRLLGDMLPAASTFELATNVKWVGAYHKLPAGPSTSSALAAVARDASFARSSNGYAVQTETARLHVFTGSEDGNNKPRIGRMYSGYPAGLLREKNATNLFQWGRLENSGYANSYLASASRGLYDGADPFEADRRSALGESWKKRGVRWNVLAGGYADFMAALAVSAGWYSVSMWARAFSDTAPSNVQMVFGDAYSSGNCAASGNSITGWERLSSRWNASTLLFMNPVDTRTAPGTPGTFSGASDVVVDMIQAEAGLVATTPIPTSGSTGTRNVELLTADPKALCDGGRLIYEVQFYPLANVEDYTENPFVFADASGNFYCAISATQRSIVVASTVSGVSWAAPYGLCDWNAGDFVRLCVDTGTADDPPQAWCKIGSAATVTYAHTVPLGNVQAITEANIGLMCSNGALGVGLALSSYTIVERTYYRGGRPPWI